jgi:hypothetical protein
MTTFTFDFDLADDLDEAFDLIPSSGIADSTKTHAKTNAVLQESFKEILMEDLVRSTITRLR